ncbi:MAG: isochorismatase family protein, partial [Candidatus Gastranaerophilales bacterium]|nr:isochorismatase family protein [Candidatus Gastranaerophilales bacterium]
NNILHIKEYVPKIISAARILNIKTILTEQYPNGLGSTINAVKSALGKKSSVYEKTYFSLVKEEKIFNEIEKSNKKQAVIFGIEAHICVYQTAIELFERGYEVFVVSDISYSRKDFERDFAMQNLRHIGIQTPTLETVLFMWLEGSKNPAFKEIQSLIK